MSGRSDLYDIDVELVHETEKAWLVHDGTLKDDGKLNMVWIPKSQAQLEKPGESGPLRTLTAPEWLLKSRGLI
jgi:hypothetical protein